MIKLLTDPFLLLPTQTSVRVVWFTEFFGIKHTVTYGENLHHTAIAKTTKLSRVREDQHSQVKNQTAESHFQDPVTRDIWRHEAEITGLISGQRIPYQVKSLCENNEVASSKTFTFTTAPTPNTPLKILLTSDHQLKPMVAANLQKVVETTGQVDAVWFAGDLANIPDRASEWFDDLRGGAFFPCLQGNAKYEMEKNGTKTIYSGGEIIQHAPIFTCIGNHEVMGRGGKSLDEEFDSTIPRAIAEKLSGDLNNSFNTDTYAEIFHLPTYYAVSFGDVRLVVLYITNMWRYPDITAGRKGRYSEPEQDLLHPENWGYGQHIYEPIYPGSTQYNWLVEELNSQQFKQAKYKVVMFHHPPHSLGGNIVPAYTDPVQVIERDGESKIKAVNYEYPKDKDYIIRDVIPLLENAGVQLVFYGHSHLWNRFCSPSGMHFLETSNVGNSYGAAWGENNREVPTDNESYTEIGDPYGLEAVTPTIAPLMDANGTIPYIASNDITVFSIFDTGTGKVSSYRFDMQQPNSPVVKFDEFGLLVVTTP